jgi:ribosomal protein S6--L-glutamate ligase
MKVCFLLERGTPPRLNPIFAEVFARLENVGVDVMVRYPEQELLRLDRLTVEADLYCLKSDTEMALSVATALAGRGARIVNSLDATLRAKDKVLAAAILSQAGIPTPRSVAAARPAELEPMLRYGALILKPHRGYHGAGIKIAKERDDLLNDAEYPEFVFAQDYLANARKDLKVYVIGDEVFGVRKEFSGDSFLKMGEGVSLSDELATISRRCGRAFGLELYGLDIAEDDDGAYVIDVNYFPGYRGVPDASRRLTDHILRMAKG